LSFSIIIGTIQISMGEMSKSTDRDKPARPGRVTIVDVARSAGVSKSTVSLVLADSSLVAAPTRERVLRAMEALGYVYHRGAASLRAASSDLVGMVFSDLTNPFFTELAVGVEEALYKLNFTPILANTNENPERQTQVLRSLREHDVAGIIICPVRGADAWTFAQQWPKSIPAVITTRRMTGSPLPYVGPDNRRGAREAVEHLLRLGYRRIGFVGGDASMTTQRDRAAGWRDALNAAGRAADETLVFDSPPTRDGGREAIERAMALPQPPSAVLCYNDIVAMGVTHALAERGLVVGRDIGVVGFDDIAEAAHSAPPLTTVNADTREMGLHCAESLLGLIRGEDPTNLSFVGGARLVVRESCGATRRDRRAS
jgi:LacI family transcriptional regulator